MFVSAYLEAARVLRDSLGLSCRAFALKTTNRMLAEAWSEEKGFAHQVIDHAERYVDGQVHTNGLENFWSLLKRGIKGTYVSVEPFHLFRYLDEQVFRYNFRGLAHDGLRFEHVASHIIGKRLTYAEVTGKVGQTDSLPN